MCSLPEEQWHNYLPNPPHSLTYEWQWLVCSSEYLVSTLEALAAFGAIIGLVLFSHVADNSGRKPAIASAWVCATIGLALAAFSNGVIMAACAYFLIGFGINSVMVLDFAFIN